MIWISIYLGIGLGFAVATIEDTVGGNFVYSPRKDFFLYWLAWPFMGIKNAWDQAEGDWFELIYLLVGSCLVVILLGWALIGIPFIWALAGGPLKLRNQLRSRREAKERTGVHDD